MVIFIPPDFVHFSGEDNYEMEIVRFFPPRGTVRKEKADRFGSPTRNFIPLFSGYHCA